MKKIILLLFPISLFCQEGIQFESISWEEALSASKKTNKLIFVDAYTTWCGPCKTLERYTFTDPSVGTLYNASFINVRFDMEQYPGLELAEKYSVNLYPTLLFIDGNGNLVHRGCGAMETDEFIELGEIASNGDQTLSALREKFHNGDRTPQFIDKYINALTNACQDVNIFLEDFFTNMANDSLVLSTNWYVFNAYDFDIFGERFQFLLNNQDLLEGTIGKEAVQNKIYDSFMFKYFEVASKENFALFGVQSLIYMAKMNEFSKKKEVLNFLYFGFGEFSENWELYADGAIGFIDPDVEDSELILDVAWKFYLFVDDNEKLFHALNWTKNVLETEEPNPSIIDTYASLLFKIGRKQEAIKFEEQALQLAQGWEGDTEHFEYQLKKFKK